MRSTPSSSNLFLLALVCRCSYRTVAAAAQEQQKEEEVVSQQHAMRRRRTSWLDDNDVAMQPPSKPHQQQEQTRIVGGTTASGNDFEYHVNLIGCGGVLVAPDVILTAAHCEYLDPWSVLIGGSTYLTGLPAYVESGSATPHPDYVDGSTNHNHDLMLYKLTRPVTSRITPITLNSDINNPSGNELLTVVGLGSTKEGGDNSFWLRKVDVHHVPYSTCAAAYLPGQINEDTMLCAGGEEEGGKDSCQGDSGGPIIDQNGVLVGITSWGNGCGKPGIPGVYARVSNSLEWIQQETCRLSDRQPTFCDTTGSDTADNLDDNGDDDNGSYSFMDWVTSLFSW